MKLLERKFYRTTHSGDIEVEDIQKADFMIVKILMTKQEVEEKYPLKIYD